MSDAAIRRGAENMPVPELGDPARVQPPRLADACVAIVTTAALHVPGEPPAARRRSFLPRLSRPARGFVLGHESPNFDRSGWLADPNVVFPLDRLGELARDGAIGSVAPVHLAFAGNQQPETLATISSTPALRRRSCCASTASTSCC